MSEISLNDMKNVVTKFFSYTEYFNEDVVSLSCMIIEIGNEMYIREMYYNMKNSFLEKVISDIKTRVSFSKNKEVYEQCIDTLLSPVISAVKYVGKIEDIDNIIVFRNSIV